MYSLNAVDPDGLEEQAINLVREIVPGVPIAPRPAGDLPGIRSAIENSGRYRVANHSDRGYFKVDIVSGSVKYVTGEEYLPIRERARWAGRLADAAASRAAFLTFAQEGLIAISPLHETSRDVGIALFDYDYAEPQRIFTTEDRLGPGLFVVMPGGNFGEVRYADGLLGNATRRRAIYNDLLEQQGIREVQSIPGFRAGSLGHPDHQALVLKLEQLALLEAGPDEQVLVQKRSSPAVNPGTFHFFFARCKIMKAIVVI